MKYFAHRPYAFWFSMVVTCLLVLAAAFIAGAHNPSAVDDKKVVIRPGAPSETARSLMAAYGEVITAPDVTSALAATNTLIDLAKTCAAVEADGWMDTECAEVVAAGENLRNYLEDNIDSDEVDQAELVAKRRLVGTAISNVVTETP